MNGRGFFKIIIAIVIIIILIAGGFLYFSFYKDSIKIGSGDVSIKIEYNSSDNNDSSTDLDNLPDNLSQTESDNSNISFHVEEVK